MKFILAGLFVIIASFSMAQTSLDSLLEHAIRYNHEMQKAQMKVQEAGYSRRAIVGQGLPQIKGTATYGKITFDNMNWLLPQDGMPGDLASLFQQLQGMDKLYLASGTVQISQLIYSREFWIGMSAAQKEQELYSILTSATEEEVIYNITSTWYHIGVLKLQLKLEDKVLTNLKEVLKAAELNYENHLIKLTDVNRLKVAIANNKTIAKTIRDGIMVQENLLKVMAGLPTDSTLIVEADSIGNNSELDKNLQIFRANELPSYQAMLKQVEISEEQIKLARSKYLPTLAAFAQLNKSAYNTRSELKKWSGINFFWVNLNIPLFTSGTTRAGVKQAEIKQLQLKQDLASTKEYLKTDYDNALSNYTSGLNALTAQRENRKLAEEIYTQTKLQYDEGMVSITELLSANNDLLQAENLFLQQVLKYKIAWLDLLKATGSLKNTLIHHQDN